MCLKIFISTLEWTLRCYTACIEWTCEVPCTQCQCQCQCGITITCKSAHIAHISPKPEPGKFLRCDVMVSKFICAHRICWCSISMSKWRTPCACANYFLIWFRSLWDWTWREMNTLNLLFLRVVKGYYCWRAEKEEVDRQEREREVFLHFC